MYKNSFGYFKESFNIVRKKFKKNWFSILFMFIATSVSSLTIVLAPFAPMILIGTVVQLIQGDDIQLNDVLANIKFTFDKFFSLFVLNSFVFVIILTGYTLFIIPGIILSFSLAPVYYLAFKNPDADAGSVIKQAMELMKGHKMRFFKLQLLVGVLTYLYLAVGFFLNVIPILGQIIFLGIVLTTVVLPTVSQVLFFMDLNNDRLLPNKQ